MEKREVTERTTFADLMTKPAAFIPLVCSALALAVVVSRILLVGKAPDHDEGAAAHLFQLLVVAQVPLAVTFAIRHLPRVPRAGFTILLLQATAAAVAMAPVAYFNL